MTPLTEHTKTKMLLDELELIQQKRWGVAGAAGILYGNLRHIVCTSESVEHVNDQLECLVKYLAKNEMAK
jgi:hypothetical protein